MDDDNDKNHRAIPNSHSRRLLRKKPPLSSSNSKEASVKLSYQDGELTIKIRDRFYLKWQLM